MAVFILPQGRSHSADNKHRPLNIKGSGINTYYNMSKILVIDDQKSIRNPLKDILEYEKHEVVLAENGPQGLDLFDNDKFDIVLCDIKMPEMDGLEVLQKIGR